MDLGWSVELFASDDPPISILISLTLGHTEKHAGPRTCTVIGKGGKGANSANGELTQKLVHCRLFDPVVGKSAFFRCRHEITTAATTKARYQGILNFRNLHGQLRQGNADSDGRNRKRWHCQIGDWGSQIQHLEVIAREIVQRAAHEWKRREDVEDRASLENEAEEFWRKLRSWMWSHHTKRRDVSDRLVRIGTGGTATVVIRLRGVQEDDKVVSKANTHLTSFWVAEGPEKSIRAK
ncbi:hypothetical protein M427DRAFT_43206 [Gonapodya prolifera JEL478]|uniref:Uncharacterized protein n=1 Tax=Gonapodya prolifera (strain JEL478) TaxID=1344416 RepID=A0A139AKH9_GONPJ|nr:hypothetical protein M427DRAFT_43206 [Gonapodya prolifera JEL478]|eukprot:KXS17277.1 hypothetical protein M427DRAFT_43206 [Gonapodya prolifera JEL478]